MFSWSDIKMALCFTVINRAVAITLKATNDARAFRVI